MYITYITYPHITYKHYTSHHVNDMPANSFIQFTYVHAFLSNNLMCIKLFKKVFEDS